MGPNGGGPFAALEEAAARQSQEEQAVRSVSAARARLILGRDARSVFFATLALRLVPEVKWDVETMATDGKRLAYNPAFVVSLTVDELVGVLAHEVMHNARAHPVRQAGREAATWNAACDLAINSLLLDAGFVLPAGKLVPGEGRYQDLPPGKSAEEYYAAIQKQGADGQQDRGQCPADCASGGSSDLTADPGQCGSVLPPADASPAAAKEMEADWQVAVGQAKQAASARGDLPGGLGRAVDDVLHPPADWRQVLREFVSSHARNDYSWARPNRRLLAQGLYLPGLHSEELGQVVLAVDTSGSINEKLLGAFAAESNAVLAAFECTVTVLYHDTEVQKVQAWRSADGPLGLDPVGGGGTSHACVFDWLDRADLDPACVSCRTDLETEFPATIPAWPVLWAVPGGSKALPPFGRVVALQP